MAYFGTLDTISHMFWRYKDEQDSSHKDVILQYYQKMDDIVGDTLTTLSGDDLLFVVSDHGFGSFDYEMNLNSWLRDNGYLVLKEGK